MRNVYDNETTITKTEVKIINALWDIGLDVDAEDMRRAVMKVSGLYNRYSTLVVPWVLENAIKEGRVSEE